MIQGSAFPGRLTCSVVVCLDLQQTGEEGSLRDQRRTPTMVRMPIGNSVAEDQLGLIPPDHPDDLQLMFRIIFEKTIPHTQVLATTETQNSGGFPGFLIP